MALRSAGPWRQTLRTLIAVSGAWIVGNLLGLPETIWALITALIVTQARITDTVSTARDQITGTLIGAVAGTAVILARILSDCYWPPFWLALAPLTFLAAVKPALRFSAITLMIVTLLPVSGSPFGPLKDRLLAIFLGTVISVVVSRLVLHESACRKAFLQAAQLFRELGDLLGAALAERDHWAKLEEKGERCVSLLNDLNSHVIEARQERFGKLDERRTILIALPPLMRRLMGDTLLAARMGDAGTDVMRGGLAEACEGLKSAYDELADACEARARHNMKKKESAASKDDLAALLSRLGHESIPELSFVIGLLSEDLERAGCLLGVVVKDRSK
ncbi:FUSC family protein [Brytella acorum]|uniref:FUSC family protein n=1 Tax=Brytella acorum TaxID=2959299 RepID=A0AA35Y395_9PROT|nr:FUSC family protein [Brytella acorum]MDF3623589.1 FUSC family protein [Brytella acorum]CAI9119993.1 FUSC family protein [Brytella acorum]